MSMMKLVSKTLNKLCCKMIILLASLLIELIIFIQKIKSSSGPITTKQYLKLIEKNNPTVRCTKRLKGTECRVCLSEFEEGEKLRKLKCQHTFHRDCLDKWLQQYWATCPLCRTQVLPQDVVFNYRHYQAQAQAQPQAHPRSTSNSNHHDHNLLYLLSAFRSGNNFETSLQSPIF